MKRFIRELFCKHEWIREKRERGWHTKQCKKCHKFVMKLCFTDCIDYDELCINRCKLEKEKI